MKVINIVGNGLSGLLVTANLIKKTYSPLFIRLFDPEISKGKGVAYSTLNKNHLLNVTTEKMSAFYEDSLHFFNWVKSLEEYKDVEPEILLKSYLPRKIYGKYLEYIYDETIKTAKHKQCVIMEIHEKVIDIKTVQNTLKNITSNNEYDADFIVIASGNNLPRNPISEELSYIRNENYFRNPWKEFYTNKIKSNLPILIIGNGLTMVDTVISLSDANIRNKLFSISPNGYGILPHRGNNIAYNFDPITLEHFHKKSLLEMVSFINKERKKIRKLGLSSASLIDAIRPIAQKIWMNLTLDEQKYFLSKLRHKWGVARHRLPIQIHDRIQLLRLTNKLEVIAGKIQNINEENNYFIVNYSKNNSEKLLKLKVSRIINCTGPEQNISLSNNDLLKNMLNKGLLIENKLNLGIDCDPETLLLKNKDGLISSNIYTLGTNLRGVFWESTAVGEIKIQANIIAEDILNKAL
jgi:uncharacterized NAD(P)/FAD-binding protein YdhS